MIPLKLIHAHNDAVVDAAYEGALLGIETMRRLSHYALASRRQQLEDRRLHGNRADTSGTAQFLFAIGTQAMAEYRHGLEVSGDAYEQWAAIFQSHWHLAHDRAQTAIAYMADHAPGEAATAVHMAQMGNDFTMQAADSIARGSKATIAEATAEIASALPSNPARGRASSKARAR